LAVSSFSKIHELGCLREEEEVVVVVEEGEVEVAVPSQRATVVL
jgi:hypothetical protein